MTPEQRAEFEKILKDQKIVRYHPEFIEAMKAAYNLAVRRCASTKRIKITLDNLDDERSTFLIDKSSITKNLIQ